MGSTKAPLGGVRTALFDPGGPNLRPLGRASTRAPPTLSQRGSRRAPPGRSVLVRDGDPRLQGAEHTRRMARAAQILHSRPSMAAAGRVGWREGRVVRMIPQISLEMAVSFPGEAGEHAPRVRARVDEWSPRDRRTTFRVRAHTAQLRVVTRLPIARAGCKCSSLAPVHGGRDWRLGRRGRAVLNRHVEVAGLDPSNCHTPGAEAHQVLRHTLRQMHAF